jgi:chitinase
MNQKKVDTPSEAEIVGRSRVDHIYTHDWANGEGRYLNVILDDSGSPKEIDIDLEPNARNRIKVTLSFVREAGDIRMIELKKFKHYKRSGWQPAPDSAGFGHEHITTSRR